MKKCVECGSTVAVGQKYFCEECFIEMLDKKLDELGEEEDESPIPIVRNRSQRLPIN